MNKLQIFQSQLIKPHCSKHINTEFEIIQVKYTINKEVLTFVFKYFANSLPPALSTYYDTLASSHCVNTQLGFKYVRKVKTLGTK